MDLTSHLTDKSPLSPDEYRHQLQLQRGFLNITREAGYKLRLPQTTISWAIILIHKINYFKLKNFQDICLLSKAVLLIASKAMETPRKVRDVINVVYRMLHPSPAAPIEVGSNKYRVLKDLVLKHEQIVLREIGFCVIIPLPHPYLLCYLDALTDDSAFVQTCWNLLNDALMTPSVALSPLGPRYIAATAIYLGAKICTQLHLPVNASSSWFEAMNVSLEEVKKMSQMYLNTYLSPFPLQPGYLDPRFMGQPQLGDWEAYVPLENRSTKNI